MIAGMIFCAFKLFRFNIPRFANLWQAAFISSVLVVLVVVVGAELFPAGFGTILVAVIATIGGFVAYDQTLETPDGERMGRKAAVVALAAHAVTLIVLVFFALSLFGVLVGLWLAP